MMLFECLLALVIIAIAILAVTAATTSGHQHQQYSENAMRAIRLAEHLLEEIQSRPYSGNGVTRPSYHIDDYHNLQESPGQLRDFSDVLYDPADQRYGRTATISNSTQTMAALEGAVVVGKTAVVTVQDASGAVWQLSRFIPEPVSP